MNGTDRAGVPAAAALSRVYFTLSGEMGLLMFDCCLFRISLTIFAVVLYLPTERSTFVPGGTSEPARMPCSRTMSFFFGSLVERMTTLGMSFVFVRAKFACIRCMPTTFGTFAGAS